VCRWAGGAPFARKKGKVETFGFRAIYSFRTTLKEEGGDAFFPLLRGKEKKKERDYLG